MAAIGSSWAAGSWPDGVWANGTWAGGGGVSPIPGRIAIGRLRRRRLVTILGVVAWCVVIPTLFGA